MEKEGHVSNLQSHTYRMVGIWWKLVPYILK